MNLILLIQQCHTTLKTHFNKICSLLLVECQQRNNFVQVFSADMNNKKEKKLFFSKPP